MLKSSLSCFTALIFVLSAFLPRTAYPQEQTIQSPVNEEVEVSLVSIYASVRDSKDRPVKGLEKEDFMLTNGDQPLDITQFSGDPSEPASVAFLVDTSGSMRVGDKYGIAEKLVDKVLEKLQRDDEASLIVFGDEKVATAVELTQDKSLVSNAVSSQKLYGPTALWDAIVFTQKMVIQNYGKKAVILISDGFDNRSENLFKRAVEEASKIQLPVYVCELTLPEEEELREINFDSPLKSFAEATGALHYSVGEDEKDIQKVAERLVEEIRYQYYLGISGGALGPSPRIRVKMKNGNYQVRLRHSIQD